MTLKDKAILERLHTSKKATRRRFSSLEFDELIVDLNNAGSSSAAIINTVKDKLNLVLSSRHIQQRLTTLRRRGINIMYKYKYSKGNKLKSAAQENSHFSSYIERLARVGAMLRHNNNSPDAAIRYVEEVIRETVRLDVLKAFS